MKKNIARKIRIYRGTSKFLFYLGVLFLAISFFINSENNLSAAAVFFAGIATVFISLILSIHAHNLFQKNR